MIWWSILTGLLVGTLWGEAWIWWRDKQTQPRHATEPAEGTVSYWLNRAPVDLDEADRAHRGTKL